jgi:apolipoprotein N-acyltransferase
MDLKPDRVPFVFVVVAVLSSAVAFYFGTGLHPLWWLTWLAPLPLLLVAPRSSRATTFLASWLAAAAGALNLWHYFRHDLESPLILSLVVILLPNAVFALGVLLFRRSVLRGGLLRPAVILPAFWVTYEYLQSISSPHSTALNLAYTQMNFLPALQIASLTGIWGISFCVLLFSATLATLGSAPDQTHGKKILAAMVAVFFLAVFGFAEWRLHSPPPSNVIKVALLASDLPQNILPTAEDDAMRLLRDYAAQVDSLASQRVQAIVIPEKIAVVRESYLNAVDSQFTSVAAKANATVVVGVVLKDQKGLWNEARVYSPEGGAPLTYEKHHMLPPFETPFVVGTWRTLLHQPSGIWGVTICKDMDFPRLSRQYALDGAGLLLVPAWDFDSDGWLHGRMGILRGVEDGFSIARAPRHGILTLTDDTGRILAERATNSAPFTILVGDIPVRRRATLYSRFGDWFAWLCIALFLLAWLSPQKNQQNSAK